MPKGKITYEVWVGTTKQETCFANPEGHDGFFDILSEAEAFAKTLLLKGDVAVAMVIERKVVRQFAGLGSFVNDPDPVKDPPKHDGP